MFNCFVKVGVPGIECSQLITTVSQAPFINLPVLLHVCNIMRNVCSAVQFL